MRLEGLASPPTGVNSLMIVSLGMLPPQ